MIERNKGESMDSYVLRVADYKDCEVLSKYESNKKVKFLCRKHNHEFNMLFSNFRKDNRYGCEYCKREALRNKLSKNIDAIKLELNTINPNIQILSDYTENNRYPLECICLICKNTWTTNWDNLKSGKGCPECSNVSRIIKLSTPKQGESIIELKPIIGKYLKNKQDGYNTNRYSEKKLEMICPDCGEPKMVKACNFFSNGFTCGKCGDGISIPNKFVYNVLHQLKADFCAEKTFKWSKRTKYDFYINDIGCIIEVNGKQHTEEVNRRNGRNEVLNDRFKIYRAFKNGIKKYISIEAYYSDFSYLRENTIKELSRYYDLSNIDWSEVYENSLNSNVKIAFNMRQQGYKIKDISKKLKLHDSTIRRYIKKYEGVINEKQNNQQNK